MAYRQFTSCTSVTNYIGASAAQVIVGAAIGAIPLVFGLIAGALAAGPAILAAMIVPVLAVIAYCRWWLFDRLICLGGDRCAVGRLLGVEPPEQKEGQDAFDTDYSINLLLPPHDIGATQAAVGSDGFQGHLIANHPDISAEGLDFEGYASQVHSSDPPSAALHCEFEGGGVYHLLLVCLALLGYLVAALVAATIICAIPVIGWVACLIISLIFAAIAGGILAAGIANALNDTGNPNHVNANLGSLHPGDDLLVVQGTWVYDSAHEGWNELHPIKHCQRIGTWQGSWEAEFAAVQELVPAGVIVDARVYRDVWCEAVAAAADPLTGAAQARPENQWEIHPEIDGCRPEDDGEVPIIK
jgi:hypothetical protein